MKYVKHIGILLTVITICFSVIYTLSISFAQSRDGNDFRITQILQNDVNRSIVAFKVFGSFRGEDVVNIYSNDVFVKAKAINTSDLIGTKEITVDNISIDVFQTGDNLIVARLERSGAEVQRTPTFRLTIQEPPEAPTITALVNREENLVGLDIEGVFEENDIVRVFLNGAEMQTRKITSIDTGERVIPYNRHTHRHITGWRKFFYSKYSSRQSRK